MQRFSTSSFWGFLSDFYRLASERTRDKFEYFWEGLSTISSEMIRAVSRFIETTDPESAPTSPSLGIYGVEVDIIKSKPYPIDSTNPSGRSVFVPKRLVANPTPTGRCDRVVVEKYIYDAFSGTAVSSYAVVNNGIDSRYYKVLQFLTVGGEYLIELEGDLSYIGVGAKVQVHLTSGRRYDCDPYIIDLPWLRSSVMDDTVDGIKLIKDTDFIFSDGVVEFVNDIVGNGSISNGGSMFCENVPVIESNLFNSYGAVTGIRDWRGYGFDGIGARTAVSAMMQALQNPQNVVDFEKGLSVLLGLPLAPTAAAVVGVYESYDYEVVAVAGNVVTFSITDTNPLHQFIQVGTKMIVDGVDDEVDVAVVTDRVAWVVELADASIISIGDKLNVRLRQRIPITAVSKSSSQNSKFTVSHWTDGSDMDYIVDCYDGKGIDKPVFFIGDNVNYNGCYHAGSMSSSQFEVCDEWADDEVPLYNDFVVDADSLTETVCDGYIHIPWPTHKYVLLRLDDGTLYKAYVDSRIDTVLEAGDAVDKYQPLTRCLRVGGEDDFPMWSEYDGFNKNNGLDTMLNVLEMVWLIPGSQPQTHFIGTPVIVEDEPET